MGIAASGGVGKFLTEWIIDGMPSIDLSSHDILRHVPHHNNPQFLAERVKETLGKKFKVKCGKFLEWKLSKVF